MSKKPSLDELDGGKLWLAWYGLIALLKEGPATRRQLFLAGPEAKRFLDDTDVNQILSKSTWQKQYADSLVAAGICRLAKEDNKQVYEVANEVLLCKILSIPLERGNQYLNCLLFPLRHGTLARWLDAERGSVTLEEDGDGEDVAPAAEAVEWVDGPEPESDTEPGPTIIEEPPETAHTSARTPPGIDLDETDWDKFQYILNGVLTAKFAEMTDTLLASSKAQTERLDRLMDKLDDIYYIADSNKTSISELRNQVSTLKGDIDIVTSLRKCIDDSQAFTALASDVLSKINVK